MFWMGLLGRCFKYFWNFQPLFGEDEPVFWRAYFSNGLKLPSRLEFSFSRVLSCCWDGSKHDVFVKAWSSVLTFCDHLEAREMGRSEVSRATTGWTDHFLLLQFLLNSEMELFKENWRFGRNSWNFCDSDGDLLESYRSFLSLHILRSLSSVRSKKRYRAAKRLLQVTKQHESSCFSWSRLWQFLDGLQRNHRANVILWDNVIWWWPKVFLTNFHEL